MKRYILFAGEWYYPSGGVYEIVGVYETEQQVLQAHDQEHRQGEGWAVNWAHILDIETHRVRVWSTGDERWSDWKEWDRLGSVNMD